MESEGRQLHAKAAHAREEGKFNESLDFNDQALFAYDGADDSIGFAEGVACRSITLRVYASAHDSRRLLILAKYEMMASVQIARDSDNPEALPIPLFELGKAHEYLGEYTEAVKAFSEAVKTFEDHAPSTHNRPSVLSDMKIHLAAAQYENGDKTALARAEDALADLTAAEEPSRYNKDVWVSGGHMHIAEMLQKDDSEKAREHLQRAKAIIDANPELILRKQQWKKLAASFS